MAEKSWCRGSEAMNNEDSTTELLHVTEMQREDDEAKENDNLNLS